MLSPEALYPGVRGVVQALGVARPGASEASVANLVTAVLLGQSLRRAELGRAQASERSVPARQRYLRVARGLTRPWLSSAELTPHLIRAALAVVDDPVPHLAMDTVRCGAWESITVGVVWHGRVLPIGWEVLPYPWPKGQFTPAVTRLLWRISAAWPAERRPHLVADRGFPSLALFRTLEQLGWGWTIRLRARLTVGVDGTARHLRDLLAQARPGAWTGQAITYGTGRQRVPGHLVLGRGDALPSLPRHQANPGSARHRRRQQIARQQEVRGKHPARRTSSAEQTDGWLILFTSHPDWLPASRSYTRRWSAEGSYRDAQGGYDGQHGWDLEDTLAHLTEAALVDRVFGLWALGTLVQSWIGHHLGPASVPDVVREVRAHWTTSGRLSVWMRGRFALTDPSSDLHPWLLQTLTDLAQRLRAAPLITPHSRVHAA
jgi:Transposase DDE domain